MLEKEIERKVCDHAKAKGMMVYKFTSPNRAAVPDRLFIYKGRMWFIEFKATGKKPTAPQVREIGKIRDQGLEVFVVDDVTMGKTIIDTLWVEVEIMKS